MTALKCGIAIHVADCILTLLKVPMISRKATVFVFKYKLPLSHTTVSLGDLYLEWRFLLKISTLSTLLDFLLHFLNFLSSLSVVGLYLRETITAETLQQLS